MPALSWTPSLVYLAGIAGRPRRKQLKNYRCREPLRGIPGPLSVSESCSLRVAAALAELDLEDFWTTVRQL